MTHSDFLWVQVSNNQHQRIGLSDQGRAKLGTVSFIDVPATGVTLIQGGKFISVEAQKAVTDVACPVSGKVVAVNQQIIDNPTLLSSTDRAVNWIVEVK